jgi:hypothetical protein
MSAPDGSGQLQAIWNSTDISVGYDFPVSDWNGSFSFNHRTLDDSSFDTNDAIYYSSLLRLSHNCGSGAYCEGDLSYNVSDVSSGGDLRSWRIGALARDNNALGIDNLTMTGRLGWESRTDGPSKMHPQGDRLDMGIDGRWQAAPDFRLCGSWNYLKADSSHSDLYTLAGFRENPDVSFIENGRIYTDDIISNHYNLGARWDITDYLDFAADLNWIERDDLPWTDLLYPMSPSLKWDSETHHVYTLRYRPQAGGGGAGLAAGNWLLKYETRNRSNQGRATDSDVEHLSINWTGSLNDDLWVYAGGGFLETDNTYPGFEDISQDGGEFGGGWNWALENGWSFFGDYWRYDVGGSYGYDQTNFSAGLDWQADEDWGWTLEYRNTDGTVDDYTDLSYNVEDLLLTVSYKW